MKREMRNMKRIFAMVLFAGLMSPIGLRAQEVYKVANKRVILDLTEAAGMPPGSMTPTSKTSWYDSFTASNTVFLDEANNLYNGSINEKVFQKLEVAPRDMNTTGGMTNTGTMPMPWATAFNQCKGSTYDSDNGRWRLPTQRELLLMWIFKPALNSLFVEVGGTAFFESSYWSATENTEGYAWMLKLPNGETNYFRKADATTGAPRARCVREVN